MISIHDAEATVVGKVEKLCRPINYEVLGSEILNLLDDYLAKHSNITINGFAEKNGISPSSLYYLKKSDRRSKIKADLVLKVACGVSGSKNPASVIQEAKGEVGALLKSAYQSLLMPNKLSTEPELDKYLTNKNAMIIALLAHNKSGTTRREIKELLDGFAIQELEKMLSAEVLKEENGKITGHVESLYLDAEQTKSAVAYLSHFAKTSEIEKGQNDIKVFWGSLTPEGIKKRKEVTQKYIAELREIYNTHETEDGIPDFTTILADTITAPELGELQ
ncbi:hypothetical protein BALOs_0702 [Halobacteriovorax sp. BALOs_7]|uniref:hypothetical protein n=1 Tax=Halobacteriovorax sp. BALOs_7 TaxID=2109558 RepID=UPI000EA3208E|nr:hypothetical protein [Halobacteriovorax sp. BALOs_7]AYF43712.1 hypothetical protein BALOs_0702 [Halobacteriovorax sp. BALOs_7]